MCYNSLSALEWSPVAVGSCVVAVAVRSCVEATPTMIMIS